MLKDTYHTIETSAEGMVFKDKGSKFYGFIYKVSDEFSVKEHIEDLKARHYKARHWCYAYHLGTSQYLTRANDDGEPNNSAGQPILGQIRSFELTNVLIVVVRYFGGTKLGVGGLINAYKSSARLAIEAASIVEKTIDVHLKLSFNYEFLNKVMQLIKTQQLTIVSQHMEMDCVYVISVRKSEAERIALLFQNLRCLHIKKVN